MILKKILNLINDDPPLLDKCGSFRCCLCNAESNDGAKFNKIFSKSTFNLNHAFKNMRSDYICNYCAVFFSRENWIAYCERNGKDPYFPEVQGKKRTYANWVFFSHYFAKNDHRIVKNRHEWREYLTNPPEPPFCFVLSAMCKKHLIFKSEIAYQKDCYPVRFEEDIIYINVTEFKKCLESFEILYSMGLSKSTIVTGNYSSSALLKVNKKLFFEHEKLINKIRFSNKNYLLICEFIGKKNEL
jgi:hypothetical protein